MNRFICYGLLLFSLPGLADHGYQNHENYFDNYPSNDTTISNAAYDADTPLVENQWGIAEPSPETIVSPTNFDVVFVPLVGFNEQCFRMGMGKGFYDRTFSFKIFNRCSRPLLVGLAHESQLVKEAFPVESWDVRLDAIATDKKIYRPDTA